MINIKDQNYIAITEEHKIMERLRQHFREKNKLVHQAIKKLDDTKNNITRQ